MLTEFFIDQDFLKSKYLNDEDLSAIHKTFLNNWKNYGVLITSQELIPKYMEAINLLPPKYKNLWKTAFTYNRSCFKPLPQPDLSKINSFQQATSLSSDYNTAFVEETLSLILCENGELSRHCKQTQFEIVSAPTLEDSENIKLSRLACERDISSGENISDIWSFRFHNMAKHSKKLFISDRYLFERVLKDAASGVSSTSIKNFFSFLSTTGGKFYVAIGSDGGAANSQDHFEIVNYFRTLFKKTPNLEKCVNRLTLISSKKDTFQKYSHDRYVRFENSVCEIGTGMAIFERRPLSNTSISIKQAGLTNSADIERTLRAQAEWTDVITD